MPQHLDWRSLLRDASWAALFALAYGQSPLFTSNQNQYFLHGMAKSGVGQLDADWLATTVDPTPLFTWLVRGTVQSLASPLFYVEYGVLLGLYFLSLRAVLVHVAGRRAAEVPDSWVSLALIAMHAAPTRLLLTRASGPEAAFLLEGGLAGQRLLGNVLQPSAFGVLLVASIALFVRGRTLLAVVSAVLAATFHPTYLLSAALLTAAYVGVEFRSEGGLRGALQIGGLALVLVLPSLLTTAGIHRPTSPAIWGQAARVLVEERIPQHAIIAEWMDPLSLVTILFIVAGLWLARGGRALPVLLVPALGGAALSLLQWASGSLRLALLFPWRVSTVLVPVGSGLILVAIILPGIVYLVKRRPTSRVTLSRLAPLLAVALALGGAARTVLLYQEREIDAASDLFQAVRAQLEPGQRYLIPPKLQRFRLETGAPAFVDFKSIPYRDTEVLEWRERLRLARFFYRDQVEFVDCGLLPRIHEREGITHVILERDQFGLECPGLTPLYQNPDLALFAWSP